MGTPEESNVESVLEKRAIAIFKKIDPKSEVSAELCRSASVLSASCNRNSVLRSANQDHQHRQSAPSGEEITYPNDDSRRQR